MQKNKIDHIDQELIKRASEEIQKDKRYIALQDKYKKQMQRRQYVQAMQTKAIMDEQMRNTVERMIEREIEIQKDTYEIMKRMGEKDRNEYRSLLNCLCFSLDVIESILVDLNGIMIKNNIEFALEALPELIACKKRVSSIIGSETKKMNQSQLDMYIDEADNLYSHLRGRGEAFRVECDKLDTKV